MEDQNPRQTTVRTAEISHLARNQYILASINRIAMAFFFYPSYLRRKYNTFSFGNTFTYDVIYQIPRIFPLIIRMSRMPELIQQTRNQSVDSITSSRKMGNRLVAIWLNSVHIQCAGDFFFRVAYRSDFRQNTVFRWTKQSVHLAVPHLLACDQ